jgi:hypothetical protein
MTIITPTRHWACPNCTFEDVTHEVQPHSRFHRCKGLAGLLAPMVPAGTRADVRAVEREDYIGDETPQLAPNGRPVMAVVTERDDGQDAAVFAGLATNGDPAR